jgi:hypothetical protein
LGEQGARTREGRSKTFRKRRWHHGNDSGRAWIVDNAGEE